MPAYRPLAQRFWEKVRKTDNCWNWTGAVSTRGYGVIGVTAHRTDYAHRVSYRLAGGVLPSDRRFTLDHLCRNSLCVNPGHLELVAQRENIHRGELGILRSGCRRGHPYPENERRRWRTGARFCIACRREYDRNRRPNRKGCNL